MKTGPEVLTTIIDGRVEVILIVFRDGVVAHETIAMQEGVLVDVDEHNVVIAIQLSPSQWRREVMWSEPGTVIGK